MRKFLGWEPLVGYASYMIGAALFNVNTVLGYDPDLLPWEASWLMWFPAAIGSALFTLGGFLECYHNRVWNFECGKAVFWVSICNFFGGVLFLFAATCGTAGLKPSKWLIDLTYLVGSILFLIGSSILLFLWKSESYGLGFIKELNVVRSKDTEKQRKILESQSQYGCGRSNNW
jgi:hypothetical protein